MKAVTFTDTKKVSFETIADPKIQFPSDVIVKVTKSGLCGSDLHIYRGLEKGLDVGTAMGHEFVGEIVESGKDVQHFKKGDRVLSPFSTNCGECFFCRTELFSRCEKGQLYGWVEKGSGLHGGQAEYVRVPHADSTLRSIPENVNDEEALFLCDILPTGFFGADMCNPHPKGTYAVIGCGPVGLMGILGLQILGAEKIFAFDLEKTRLEKASSFGARAFSAKDSAGKEALLEATNGRGVDAVLEAVGNASSQRLAYDILRPGGKLSVVGVHNEAHLSILPVELYDKNLTYQTGRCPVQKYIGRLIPVMQEKQYPVMDIVSHRLPLEQGPEAYQIFEARRENAMKILFEL